MGCSAEIKVSIDQESNLEKFEEALRGIDNCNVDSDGTAYISCRNTNVEEILDLIARAGIAAVGEIKYPTADYMNEVFEIKQAESGEFIWLIHTAAELAQSEIWDEIINFLNEGGTSGDLLKHAMSQRITTTFDSLY